FPPIDIWPSPSNWSPTLSEFTPVTDARPDPDDAPTHRPGAVKSARPQILRMVRWVRPEYPRDLALAGQEATVLLDLRIGPDGKPGDTRLIQSSGSKELDQAVLHAAALWGFAPPLWKMRPIEVTCRIELRFHGSRTPASGG